MNRRVLAMVALILAVGAATYVYAGDPRSGPEEGTIVGEVIDIGGYAMKGLRGREGAEAGRYRAGLGFPIGILEDETERVYIALYRLPVPAAGLQTANTVLAPFMGEKVVAHGAKYHAKGLDVIRISAVAGQ